MQSETHVKSWIQNVNLQLSCTEPSHKCTHLEIGHEAKPNPYAHKYFTNAHVHINGPWFNLVNEFWCMQPIHKWS